MFRGAQTGNVDAKGRMKLPSAVQRKLKEAYESGEFFITSLDGETVKVFPIQEWERLEARLAEKSTESNQAMDGSIKNKILFQANRFGSEETLDNQGRLLVPAALRDTAGMRGEVKLQWQANHIMVVSAERYGAMTVENKLTAEELGHAANLGF